MRNKHTLHHTMVSDCGVLTVGGQYNCPVDSLFLDGAEFGNVFEKILDIWLIQLPVHGSCVDWVAADCASTRGRV